MNIYFPPLQTIASQYKQKKCRSLKQICRLEGYKHRYLGVVNFSNWISSFNKENYKQRVDI